MTRHVFEEHTGEVRLRIEAGTLAGIFEEAARALAELTAGRLDARDDRALVDEHVSLGARDLEALLVEWLNEIVFRSETQKRAYPWARVERIDAEAARLEATLRGVPIESVRTAVKAATLHDVRVARASSDEGAGWSARVVLDV